MRIKTILLFLLVVFVGIQFIPTLHNQNNEILEIDISKSFSVPIQVQEILKTSCYDCHSNTTIYPWYNRIQPVSFLLESHIKEGKNELNFSTFGAYSKRKQKSKLKSIKNQVEDNEMPLFSYTLIHRKTKLSKKNKILIIQWAMQLRDSL